MPGVVHLAGMLGASYLLLLSAGVLQIAPPLPSGRRSLHDLFDLWLAFTLACVGVPRHGSAHHDARGHRAGRAGARSGRVPADADSGRRRRSACRACPAGCSRSRRLCRAGMPSMRSTARSRDVDSPVSRPNAAALAVMAAASGLAALAVFRWDVGAASWACCEPSCPWVWPPASWIAVGVVVNVDATLRRWPRPLRCRRRSHRLVPRDAAQRPRRSADARAIRSRRRLGGRAPKGDAHAASCLARQYRSSARGAT